MAQIQDTEMATPRMAKRFLAPLLLLDGDTDVDYDDAALLILALTDPTAYFDIYGHSGDDNGDINEDGLFDLGDIGPFNDELGSTAPAQTVPEPSTFLLAALGLLGMSCRRRKRV